MKLFILVIWLFGANGPTAPAEISIFYTEAACYQTGIKWENRVKEYSRSGGFACLPVDFLP